MNNFFKFISCLFIEREFRELEHCFREAETRGTGDGRRDFCRAGLQSSRPASQHLLEKSTR